MNKNINIGLHNKFYVEVIDAKTKQIKQVAEAYNTICTKTFERGFIDMRDICYGSGTSNPSFSDTLLEHKLGSKTATLYNENNDMVSQIYSKTTKITLESADNVGDTIAEVGIGTGNNTGTESNRYIYTHARLQDQNGLPITIVKTSADVINIYATVFVHYYSDTGVKLLIPTYFFNNIVNSGGHYYPTYIYYHQTNVPDIDNSAASSSGGTRVNLTKTYNSATRTIKYAAARLEAAQGNKVGGYRHVHLGGLYSSMGSQYQHSNASLTVGDAWFEKTSLVDESVGTGDGETTDFNLKFAWPRNAVIKVNGVIENNVTVDYAPPVTDWSGFVDFYDGSETDSNVKIPRNIYSTSVILHNLAHVIGIRSFTTSAGKVEVSNDLETWTEIGTSSGGVYTVPDDYTHYKYYRFTLAIATKCVVTGPNSYNGYNVHFDTAPEEGAIITASYDADVIAKDANSVFDFELSVVLNEYND